MCSGVLCALEHFRYYVYGHKILAKTEHKVLKKLNIGPLNSTGYSDGMIDYIFELIYVKPSEILHVDALNKGIKEEDEKKMG